MNAENARLPKEVGVRRTHPLPVLASVLAAALGLTVVSNWIAWTLHDDQALGAPQRLGWLTGYPPWSPLIWGWTFKGPFAGHWPPDADVAMVRLAIGVAIVLVYSAALFLVIEKKIDKGRTGVEEMNDSAHFATQSEVEGEGLISERSGPTIALFETPKGPVRMRYGGDGGIMWTAPSGGHKTTAALLPNLLDRLEHPDAASWPEEQRRINPYGYEPSIFVLDVKGAVYRATSGYQQSVLGKRVFKLDPFSEDPATAHYNPFHHLRIGTPHEYGDCYQMAADIIEQEGTVNATFWDRASKAFGAAVIAKTGYMALNSGEYRDFSLPAMVDYISMFGTEGVDPEDDVAGIEALVQDMLERPDDPGGVFGWVDEKGMPTLVCPWIASAARSMAGRAKEERSGVFGSLIGFLEIYRDPIVRANVSDSTFSFRGLGNGPTASAVYLCVPGMKLAHLRPYIRILTRTAIRELTESTASIEGREVRGNLRTVILALDEFAQLQRINEVEQGAAFFRGHGVIPWVFFQSVQQLLQYYGQQQTLSEQMPVRVFGRPNTYENAVPISDAMGKSSFTYQRRNVSGKRFAAGPLAQISDSTEIHTRPLMTPNEVQRLSSWRWLVFYGGLTIRARKFMYYQDPDIEASAKMPPVPSSPGDGSEPQFISSLRDFLRSKGYGVPPASASGWKRRPKSVIEVEGLTDKLTALGYVAEVRPKRNEAQKIVTELNRRGYDVTIEGSIEDAGQTGVPSDEPDPVAAYRQAQLALSWPEEEAS